MLLCGFSNEPHPYLRKSLNGMLRTSGRTGQLFGGGILQQSVKLSLILNLLGFACLSVEEIDRRLYFTCPMIDRT